MDINVNLNAGLDEDTKEIAWAFINKFGLCFKDSKTSAEALIKSPEETDKPETKAESVSDVEMATSDKEDPDEGIDYAALRKEIKKLGIKLVQAKKQSEVKTLTAKYGYTKMDELPDDKLVQYLEELKEIQNG